MIKKALLLFYLFPLTAAAQSLTFNAYTPAEGLVDTRVHKIFQDSRGVMYFLTPDGFSVFDGQRFTNYSQYQNQSLRIVSDILEEKNGRMIIVSISGIYYLQNNKLVKDTSLYKEAREPGSIFITHSGEKIISSNVGLFLYGQSQTTELKITKEDGTRQPLILDIAILKGDLLLGVYTNTELNRRYLLLYNWKTQKTVAQVSSEHLSIRQYHDKIYVWMDRVWSELNMEALKNGKLARQPLSFAGHIPAGKGMDDFFIDAEKKIWCITLNRDVCVINPVKNETNCYGKPDGLPVPVNSIFQDRENNYWFMVWGKGVCKMAQSRVEKFAIPGKNLGSPIQDYINKSPEGIISFKYGSNLGIFANNTFTEKKLKEKPGVIQVFIWNNQRWTLYVNGKLENEKGDTVKLTSFPPGTKSVSSRLAFDKAGRLLVAGSYLSVVNKDLTFATTELYYFTDNIACDDENTYWCFNRGRTIQGYQLIDNRLVLQKTYNETEIAPRYIMQWNKDTFCIGTRFSGIVFVKINNQEYRHLGNISTGKGISNIFVSDIVRINEHKLVAATTNGLDLVYLNKPDTSVEQLFSRAGLFTGAASAKLLNDSTLIALNANGEVYRVHIPLSASSNVKPFFYFNQVTVNGREIDLAAGNRYRFTEHNFQFSVSAPSFIDEKNIRFLFHLSGPETNAVQNSKRADFEYSNLQPGSYTLTATAFFPGDEPVNKTITYSFTIKKPFWKTWGFILGCIIAALLLIYYFFRSQLQKRLTKQKIELEMQQAIAHERSRIATDMHDDLGAGISTIKYLSQSAPYIPVEQQKQNNIKIAAHADELVDKMNDIIWAMNEKNDTLDNLVYYIKSWAANYAEQHKIDSHVIISSAIEPLVIRGEKRQHIFMCVKESVHNIIKHAEAKNIWLNIETTGNKLHITIRDDGKGFDIKKLIKGNGLSNMQKRIKALNGEMKTVADNGTTQQFVIPL